MTWNSIRSKFVKKTNMPNIVKSLGYISAAAQVAPDMLKSLAILSENPATWNPLQLFFTEFVLLSCRVPLHNCFSILVINLLLVGFLLQADYRFPKHVWNIEQAWQIMYAYVRTPNNEELIFQGTYTRTLLHTSTLIYTFYRWSCSSVFFVNF